MTYDPTPCDKKCCSEHSWIPPAVSDCSHRTSLSSNGYPAVSDCAHRTSLSSRGYPQQAQILPTSLYSQLTPVNVHIRDIKYRYYVGQYFSPYQECNVYTITLSIVTVASEARYFFFCPSVYPLVCNSESLTA